MTGYDDTVAYAHNVFHRSTSVPHWLAMDRLERGASASVGIDEHTVHYYMVAFEYLLPSAYLSLLYISAHVGTSCPTILCFLFSPQHVAAHILDGMSFISLSRHHHELYDTGGQTTGCLVSRVLALP